MPPIAGAPGISPAGVILPICHSFTLVLPRGRDIRIQIPQQIAGPARLKQAGPNGFHVRAGPAGDIGWDLGRCLEPHNSPRVRVGKLQRIQSF